MKLQKIKAFTLVELIIVITILAILRTIGFMSFQSYTSDARDGKRKTDLSEVRKGLELYQLKNQILPIPDEQLLTVKTGATILSYQGYLGKEVQKTIRLTNDIKDSKDNNYYTYSINGTKTKYQLLAMLENNLNTTSYKNIINQANAGIDYTNRYTYSVGSKIGIFLTGATNSPLQETSTGVDLSSNNSTYKLVFSNNTSNSGVITSSGNRLYTEIVNNQGTGGTVIQTNSCATQPVYTNATFTIGTPTSVGQARQNTNSSNPCYYVCTGGYSGNDCSTIIRGEQLYTTPGTYTWTAPAGVTSVSVVAVGGGGAGSVYSYGGGGGGLGWKNSITVIPGNTYTVVVGNSDQTFSALSGGDSYFINNTTVKGGGGGGTGAGGTYIGDGGGNGGSSLNYGNGGGMDGYGGAGGGAGGYTGKGGNGNYSSPGQNGSGGGGGGGGSSGTSYPGIGSLGGGGVGLYGQGSNGTGGSYTYANASNINAATGGSGGGSCGSNAAAGGTWTIAGQYGGGGMYLSRPGNGAVRIIRPGTTRQFPSTDVGL